MRLRTYWTMSKRGGRPADVRQGNWINGAELPPDFIQGLGSADELMDSSWVLGIIVGPTLHGPPDQWELVEIQGDEDEAIVARKPVEREGVFVKAYHELGRTPLLQWIEDARRSEDPARRRLAEKCAISIEIAAEGYDDPPLAAPTRPEAKAKRKPAPPRTAPKSSATRRRAK